MIQAITLLLIVLLSLSLVGCEAFRKKFVRKAKREKEVTVVIQTHEYESAYSLEQAYKRCFLFTLVSYEGLINSLGDEEQNQKKRISTAKKIIENLEQMRQLLLPEKQTAIDALILKQKGIAGKLDKYRLSRMQMMRIKAILEKQKRQIQKDFHYKEVKEYLRKE